jgi:hypothetical protein
MLDAKDLMTRTLMGKSMEGFDEAPHVKSWLRGGLDLTSDNHTKPRFTPTQNLQVFWSLNMTL